MTSARPLQKSFPSTASLLNVRWICAGLVLVIGATVVFFGAHAQGNRRAVELMAGFTGALWAFAYLAFDFLLIFVERSILGEPAATSTNHMYTTIPHLQSAVRLSLQKGQLCRVYKESLNACWPRLSDDEQAERIAHFAAQNHWEVNFRLLGPLGLVAEFEKAETGAHMAHG